jgi:hypothetical protein
VETGSAFPFAPRCSDDHGATGGGEAGFRSLTEPIDTTTPAGRVIMQMVGAFAEFERAVLKERTKAGLDAGREDVRMTDAG